MKELGLNQVNSVEHTGHKAFDPLRIVDRRRGLAKKSSDAVKANSPESRRSLVARAALGVENTPNRERSLRFRDAQTFERSQFGLDSGRQTGSRLTRDVRARSGMDDTGENATQDNASLNSIFRRKFIKSLIDQDTIKWDNRNNYPLILKDQLKQYLAVNYNSQAIEEPVEWRQSLLMAKGQVLEESRMTGKIEQIVSDDNAHDEIIIHKISGKSYRSFDIANELKNYPDQEVRASTVISKHKDFDSWFACGEAYEALKKSQGNQDIYNLKRVEASRELSQKTKELAKLELKQSREEIEITRENEDLKEMQAKVFLEQMQKDLSIPNNKWRLDILIKSYREEGNRQSEKIENIEKIHKLELQQKKQEIKQFWNRKAAYYIIMGAPWVRRIVEKLPKDYTIDSMTIEKKDSTGSSSQAYYYEVGLSIKRADSAGKMHEEE